MQRSTASNKGESVLLIPLSKDHKKVLLVKRRDVPIFVLPGGGIDFCETPSHAAVREALEESSCRFSILRKGLILTPLSFLTNKTHVYIGEWEEGIPAPTEESSESAFFPLEKLPSNLFFLHKEWLEEALSSPFKERPLHEITLLKVFFLFFKHPLLLFRWLFRKRS